MITKTRIAAIIIKDSKLLMLKGKGFGELWTPGGKIEVGETEEDCLRRELNEEIGVEIISLKFFKEYAGPSFYHENQITRQRIYIVSISGHIQPDAEIEDFVWLKKEDFEKKKFPMIPITEEEIVPDIIKAGLM